MSVSPPVYAILSGSTRKKSQSGKVARFVASRLAELAPGAVVELVDLATTPIESWHEGLWEPGAQASPAWQATSATLSAADALIVVSPEWNGMVPPALLNIFLMATKGELAHKPAMIVGVSAAVGGAYPVAELRAYGGKNTQLCYVPDHVIVRDARNVLNEAEPQSDAETWLRGRIDYSLQVLGAYAAAFRTVRDSGLIDLKSYPYGM